MAALSCSKHAYSVQRLAVYTSYTVNVLFTASGKQLAYTEADCNECSNHFVINV